MLKALVVAVVFAGAVLLVAGVLTPSDAQNACRQYRIRVFDAAELTRLQNVLDPGWEPFAATQGGVYARQCN